MALSCKHSALVSDREPETNIGPPLRPLLNQRSRFGIKVRGTRQFTVNRDDELPADLAEAGQGPRRPTIMRTWDERHFRHGYEACGSPTQQSAKMWQS